jgi:hypothetical protein
MQIRASNELLEILMCQTLLGEFGSANRTAVLRQKELRLLMLHDTKTAPAT